MLPRESFGRKSCPRLGSRPEWKRIRKEKEIEEEKSAKSVRTVEEGWKRRDETRRDVYEKGEE